MQNGSCHQDDAAARCEKLFRIYYRPLLKAAFRFVHDDYLAEDAVQQTFLRILKYRSCLNRISEGQEWGYLKMTLSNACFQILRQREKAVSLTDLEMAEAVDRVYCHMSAENEVLKSHAVIKEVRELPETYARTLMLHYLEGYSYEEIASMDHVNPATIRKRSQRGKEMLAKRIDRKM